MIEIKPLCGGHIEAVIAAENEFFSNIWKEEELLPPVSGPSFWLLALCDGSFCGYIGGSIVVDEGEIVSLCVLPPFRGGGVGGLLLKQWLEKAKERGAERIFLEVAVDNAPAIALYERAGFLQAGVRRGYYGNGAKDALLMKKEL